jgi:lipopolysaccharide/colanic/teichoic acid biosynthesis glycosyltransferase
VSHPVDKNQEMVNFGYNYLAKKTTNMLSPLQYRRIWKTALLPLVDFGMLVLASSLSYWLRYKILEENFEGIKKVYGLDYLIVTILLSFLVVVIYGLFGLYRIERRVSFGQTIFHLFLGIWLVLLTVITFLFFNEYNRETLPNGVVISRFILGIVGFLAFFSTVFGRFLFWAVEQILYFFDFFKVQIAVIGSQIHSDTNQEMESMETRLVNSIPKISNRKLSIKKLESKAKSIRAKFWKNQHRNKPNSQSKYQIQFSKRLDLAKIFYYDNLDEDNLEFLKKQIESQNIAEVYLFGQNNPLEITLAALCEKYKVSFIFSPFGISHFQSFGLREIFLENKHFFELVHSPLFGWRIVFKRVFDILVSFLFLIVFSWLYLIIAVLIKLESSGPVFYGSERIGPNGQVFKLWKFRRLKSEFCTSESKPNSSALEFEQKLIQEQGESANRGALYKIKNDPRSTKFGQFLEKTSLDEIPQFINVLLGSMSIVGPRPHQPREVSKYLPHHYKVLNIQPGITGMAQINGRSDLSFEEEVAFDTQYVEQWSFWLDLWIIVQTPLVLIFRKHK